MSADNLTYKPLDDLWKKAKIDWQISLESVLATK